MGLLFVQTRQEVVGDPPHTSDSRVCVRMPECRVMTENKEASKQTNAVRAQPSDCGTEDLFFSNHRSFNHCFGREYLAGVFFAYQADLCGQYGMRMRACVRARVWIYTPGA